MVVRVYVCWFRGWWVRWLVGRFLAGLLSGCLVVSMNDYLVGWFVGVLHVRACVRFGFTMWQATHLLVETMSVMRGFLTDAYAAQDAGKGKDANYTVG